MKASSRILIIVVSQALAIQAQWLDFPTAGIPRTADGKPILTGRSPRTPDGKPDFSGLWEPQAGAVTALGEALASEFLDIAVNRKEPLPYQPWALELRKTRQANAGKDDPSARCLPLGVIHMHASLVPRKMLQLPGLLVILYERNVDYSTDLHRRSPSARRSESVFQRLFDREVGRGHASCRNDWVSR